MNVEIPLGPERAALATAIVVGREFEILTLEKASKIKLFCECRHYLARHASRNMWPR
jgi:hypothetical protein